MIEKNIDKKLANRISYQIWWGGGPNLQKGPYPLTDLEPIFETCVLNPFHGQ